MTLTVYLADLRHNFGGVLSTDCMPLGMGFMKAVMQREFSTADVDARIFAYPDVLLAALAEKPADVLMVSNYVWNEAISLFFLRKARQANPGVLNVMGGPSIPVEPGRQTDFVEQHPEIDVYVTGEGDFMASTLVRAFLECDRSVARMGEGELPSSIYRRPDRTVVRNATAPRERDVNDIPSPWLTGTMDEFFDGKLAPIIETNRGCPFKCAFCVQGTEFYNRINYFDMDRLREEIAYIGKINHERSPHMGTLRIADPNYGMYKRDVEISGWIGEAQKKWGWPTFIDATTGKNRADRIIESMEKVDGALVLYQAVQSLDDEVLRNINRSNIKLSAYNDIMVHVRGRGLRSMSDLILGLPGESLKSHLDGLYGLVDAGIHQAHCFQAMMLKGADMESVATRDRFRFTTRFRVLPKNFGDYDGERVFDIEEIVVATDTLSFDDYLECRKHHLTFSVFWNDSWFSDVVALAEQTGIARSAWLKGLLSAMQADDGVVRQFLDEFTAETVNELFPTREACREFYARDENFEKLSNGLIGDNLMYKYRAKASFFLWKEICACAMDATRRMLVERGDDRRIPDFERFWESYHRYVEATHASGGTVEELVRPVDANLSYDIRRWLDDGAPLDVSPYAFDGELPFVFQLEESEAGELEAAFKVWTSKLTGLSKLVTRIRVSSQIRSCRPRRRATA
jgi:hypothetical protein